MGYRKNKTSEPGYRYAKERERYLKLTPPERAAVKAKLEEIWAGRVCNSPVKKNYMPCPRAL